MEQSLLNATSGFPIIIMKTCLITFLQSALLLFAFAISSGTAAQVAVFDNPEFVDTTSSGTDAEADNLQATLLSLGHAVSTFISIETGISGQSVVIIPEQENGDLASALTATERSLLQDFMLGGGTLIVHGFTTLRAASLINSLIDTSLEAQEERPGTLFSRSIQASGTSFEGGPLSIEVNNASDSLAIASLPPGSRTIYTNNTQCLVAVIPFGSGRVIFLGWDWWDAAPLGSQDGGWLEVLNNAVTFSISNEFPLILRQPDGQIAAEGEFVLIQVSAVASAPLSYQWLRNGLAIDGATNATFIINAVQANDYGAYRVQVSNEFGSILSSEAVLRSLQAPVEFFNSDIIRIPESGTDGPALPYPSITRVAGLRGLVGRVRVTLRKLEHTFPADLDILLVSPAGQKVMLMSRAGGSENVTNLNLTFSDEATEYVPPFFLTNGVYRPRNYTDSGEVLMPSPAPSGPYSANLSAFGNFDPNGDWLLYINDHAIGDVGSLGGWSLQIYAASPPNDAFLHSVILAGTDSTTTANSAYATKEAGEPDHAEDPGGRSLWWTWVCPTPGEVTIDTAGSSFDTLLAVYTGNSVSNLSTVASNDDTSDAETLQSKVTFSGVPGTTYRIAVDGYQGAEGNIMLHLTAQPPLPLELVCPSDRVVQGFVNVPPVDPNSVSVFGGCGSVTRSFVGESQTVSGCETRIRRTYQVVDSCQQTNTCSHTITVLSEPEIFGFTITQTTEPDGIHVLFCANVSGADFPFEWSLDNGETVFLFSNCFEAVFSPTNDETHSVSLIVRNACGFKGSASPPVVPCGMCLSRGTPSLLTGNTGSGGGPTWDTGDCGTLSANSQWYKMVASDTGLVTVSTEGSSNNTMLAVYSWPAAQLIACNEDVSLSSRQSRVTFPVEQGAAYKIAVDPRSDFPSLRVAAGFEPQLETFRLRPDGAFELQSSRAPAIPYRLQVSSQFAPNAIWSTILTTNLTQGFPYLYFLDTNVSQFPQRFYRIAPGP